MATTLNPLMENADIRTYNGKFPVQLEIPESSTLSEEDIEKIGSLASWEQDPNQGAEGYEGFRAILISRTNPGYILRKGKRLSALELSGIGYKEMSIRETAHGVRAYRLKSNGKFLYPSKQNFVDIVNNPFLGTTVSRSGKAVGLKMNYRPLGTYTQLELLRKLQGTERISKMFLEKMLTPHIEAYGRYLDENLGNEEGAFGFIVFPVPSINRPRLNDVIRLELAETMEKNKLSIKESVVELCKIYAKRTEPLQRGLFELHERARLVHLQPHSSNIYDIEGSPYLMDWSTIHELGNNREDNIANRVFDVLMARKNFADTASEVFGQLCPNVFLGEVIAGLSEISFESYAGLGNGSVSLKEIYLRHPHLLRRTGGNPDTPLYIQWMKDQGFEGFPKYESRRSVTIQLPSVQIRTAQIEKSRDISSQSQRQDIGRNSPCPCGSGRKFKHCCGRKS